MFDNCVLVGWYKLNDEPCEVYKNVQTGEVFYVDEQSVPFLIMGLEHTNPVIANDETAAQELDEVPNDGIIFDGSYKWIIVGEAGYKVMSDALDISSPVEPAVTLDFDNEYTPEE